MKHREAHELAEKLIATAPEGVRYEVGETDRPTPFFVRRVAERGRTELSEEDLAVREDGVGAAG
jgi:hypothetical protein